MVLGIPKHYIFYESRGLENKMVAVASISVVQYLHSRLSNANFQGTKKNTLTLSKYITFQYLKLCSSVKQRHTTSPKIVHR